MTSMIRVDRYALLVLFLVASLAGVRAGLSLGEIAGTGTVYVTGGSTRLFEDGFEDGLGLWDSQVGGPSTITTDVHHGSYALGTLAFGSGSSYVAKSFSNLPSVNVRVWALIHQQMPTSSYYNHAIIEVMGGSRTLAALQVIKEGSSYRWRVQYWGGAKDNYPAGVADALYHTYASFELRVARGSPGSITLYMNGAQVVSYSPKNDDVVGVTEVRVGAIYGYGSYTKETHADCVVIDDEYIGAECELPPPPTPSPPTWGSLGHNSTDAGSAARFNALWNDPDGLSGYVFSWNGTGTWTNSTWMPLSGDSAWSNVTTILPSALGVGVGYRFYANETHRGWNQTDIGILTTTKPLGWEETILSLTFSPDDPPTFQSPPRYLGAHGTLTYLNGTGLAGAWLKAYIGTTLMAEVETGADGGYALLWLANVGPSGHPVRFTFRVIYESDRTYALGSSTYREVIW